MGTNRKFVLCAAVAAVGLVAPKVRGVTYDWQGFGINGNWSTLANWDGVETPGSSDSARFGDTSSLVNQSKVDTSRTITIFAVTGPSSIGDYIFTGANTTLTVSNQFKMIQPNPVKDNATISSGLTVDCNGLLIKNDSHLTISGGGSLIAHDFQMQLPDAGPTATVVIGSGGTLRATGDGGFIDSGTLELDAGGTFNIDSGLSFNVQNSAGTLQLKTNWAVPAGATVNAIFGGHIAASNAFDVATGNTGTLLVDGGSSVTAGGLGASQWGDAAGTAAVQFSNSGVGTYNSGLRIDNNPGGAASVGIFSGAQLTVANGLYVGGGSMNSANITLNSATLATAAGGFADFFGGSTLNLQTGGVFQASGNATFTAGSTINISGGTLNCNGTGQFDSAGVVNLSGGGMNLTNGGTFESGSTFNWSGGVLSIGSGKTLTFSGGAGTLGVGTGLSNGATVHMTNGAVINSAYLDIGSTLDGGANGTLLIDVAGTKYTSSGAYTDLGLNAGDSGTMTISSSGAASFNAGLHLAGNGGKALLTLSSAGVLNATGLITGNTTAGSAATINISGGTLNSTGTSVFQSGSAVTLSSGGMTLGDNATFSTGSNFSWSGSGLSIASGKTLTFDAGTGTFASSQGLSNGATIHITDGGKVTNSRYLDFGSTFDGGANGTLLIDGAGSSYTTTAVGGEYTDFGLNAGDFGTLTISSSGAGTFSGLHLAGSGGKALVTVSSGSLNIGTLLQAGSAVSTSAATINISGGRLNSTGSAVFLGGSVLSFSGGGVGSFTGAATFLGGTIPDQLNVSSAATFSALTAGSTTINVTGGGSMTTTGNAQFNNGAALTVSGTIGQFTKFNLLGSATFLTGSSASVSGFGTLAMGTGATLAFAGGVGTFSSATNFDLPSGGTLRVTNGGKFFDSANVNIANGQSSGTLVVDGANSVLSSSTPFGSAWGTNTGNTAAATFSTGAMGTFSGLGLAFNGGAATLNLLSNAQLTLGGQGLAAGGSPGTATINISGGTLNVQGAATVSGNSFVNYQSGSFNATGGINTSNTASISVASGAVVRTGGLTMNDTSLINLNGGLIDDYSGGTPISTIRGYLLAGRNGGLGGLWKGVGINSSTAAANSTTYAVGYADASAIGSPAMFMGQSIDNTSVLVRLTYNGDANLDGKVNALDFNALATNFGKTSEFWSDGDFNFDGSVSTSDFTMLSANFGATPLSSLTLGALVPEPASMAGLGIIFFLARRQRRISWS